MLFSPVRSVGRIDDAIREHAPAVPLAARCLSYRRSRPGWASSTGFSRPNDRAGRARAHRDAGDVDPPLSALDESAAGGCGATRQEPPVSRGRRRPRPARAPDERRTARGFLAACAKKPKAPMPVRFEAAPSSCSPRAGKKKRAGEWLVTPEALDADLAHLGPDALELDPTSLAEISSASVGSFTRCYGTSERSPASAGPTRTRSCCARGSRLSRLRPN